MSPAQANGHPSTSTEASSSTAPVVQDSSKISPNDVGWQFVPQYYNFVSKQPHRLHCFYNKRSTFVHGDEGEETTAAHGQQEIHERIMKIGYDQSKVYINQIDSQSSANGGILIQVLGEMSNANKPWRKFAQTFFLAEQPNGYFVLNDIFRFLKEETDEEEADDEEAEVEVEQETVASVAVQPEPATTVPEIPAAEPEVAVLEPVVASKEEPKAEPEVEEKVEEPVKEEPTVEAKEVAKEEPKAAEPVKEDDKEEVKEPEAPAAEAEAAPAAAKVAAPAPAVAAEKPAAPAPAPTPAAPAKPKSWASLAAGPARPAWGNPAMTSSVITGGAAPAKKPEAPAAAAAPRAAAPVPAAPAAAAAATPAAASPAPANGGAASTGTNSVAYQNALKVQTAHCFVKLPNWSIQDPSGMESMDESTLRTIASRFGEVNKVEIVRGKACAFVEFATVEGARKAIIASLGTNQGGEGGISAGEGKLNFETRKEKDERAKGRQGQHQQGTPGQRRQDGQRDGPQRGQQAGRGRGRGRGGAGNTGDRTPAK